MTNSAFQLADAIAAWTVPANERPETTRGFEDRNDLGAWREVQRVTELAADVDRTLAGMNANGENVEMFLETLPAWYAAAHFATTPWNSTLAGTRQLCEDLELHLLRALGALLDSGTKPWSLTEDSRRGISDVLAEAKKLLEDDDEIPLEVRRFMWSLIARAYDVLQNYETFGPAPLREIALELGGAMHARGIIEQREGKGPRAGRWKALAAMLVTGFAGGAGEEGMKLLVHEATKQIGG